MAAESMAEVLDLLYGAVTDGDLWSPFLERFTDELGGTSAWLSSVDLANGAGAGLVSRMDPIAQPLYFDSFVGRDPLSGSVDAGAPHPLIFNDEQLIAKEELTRTEFYNDFMRRIDVHSVLMVRLWVDGGRFHTLNVNRSRRRDQFDRASFDLAARYRPHLMHATSLCQKLAQAEIRRLAADGRPGAAHLGAVPGILLLDRRARVVYADASAEAHLAEGSGLVYAKSRLGAADPAAAERLNRLVRAAIAPGAGETAGGTVALPRPGRRLPLLLQVGPVRGRLSPFHADAAAVVTLTDLDAGHGMGHGAPGAALESTLKATFNLTAAEARVAAAVADGRSPKEIAEGLHVSLQTVRSHLQRAFEKTGTGRQVELALLLIRLADRAAADA